MDNWKSGLKVKVWIEFDLNKKGKIETLRWKAYIKLEYVIISMEGLKKIGRR